jgi:hypothetical protein
LRFYLEKKANTSQKRAGRVAQSVGPEFKPQYWKKEKTPMNGLPNCVYTVMFLRPLGNNGITHWLIITCSLHTRVLKKSNVAVVLETNNNHMNIHRVVDVLRR